MAKTTFTPAGDQMAQHLTLTGGSLTLLRPGRVIRVGYGDHSVTDAWSGRELTSWKVKTSLWDKGLHVTFSSSASASQVAFPTFKLILQPPLSDADIAQAAQTYMMLLNLRRE